MQSRAAKQREIASRTASGKGGDTSPKSRRTEKRSLSSERENQHSEQWEQRVQRPWPWTALGRAGWPACGLDGGRQEAGHALKGHVVQLLKPRLDSG